MTPVVPNSHPDLLRIFRRFNKRYWNGTLPEPLIYYAHIEDPNRDGYARFGEVQLIEDRFHVRVDPLWSACIQMTEWAVLHESAHIHLWKYGIGHGARFQKEMVRLALAGAFRRIW